MKLLELFSGTGSVGKVAKAFGWTVTSLDLKNADINCDILKWDYKQIPSGYYDFIWASPSCQHYSIAKTVGERKINEANKLVLKTLEIIDYFKPRIWFLENPATGLLKKQPFMKDLAYFDIDYCKYGFNYRKRTRLWTNIKSWQPRPLCKKNCGKMIGNRHKETAQRGYSKIAGGGRDGNKHSQNELYRIPPDLIEEILNASAVNFM